MKNKMFKVMLALSVIFVTSCTTENEQPTETNEISAEFDASNIDAILSRSETNALMAQGINPLVETDIERKEVSFLGKTFEGLKVGDLFIPNNDLTEMTQSYYSKTTDDASRYASTNRLDLPNRGKRTVRVGVLGEGDEAIPQSLRKSVFRAVLNYNLLNMEKLRLQYVVLTEEEAIAGSDEAGIVDIVIFLDVFNNLVGNFDGLAFYPANGNPGRFIGLSPTTNNFTKKNNTLLVMHEMGHALGMVHSDFLTRGSCGNTEPLDPELGDLLGIPEVQAVCNIAGTDPSGDQFISIMRACGFFVWPLEDFTSEDKDAFRVLYSQVDLPCATADTPLLPKDCITDQDTIDYIFDNLPNERIALLFQLGILCQN